MPENQIEQMTEEREKQIKEFFAKIAVTPNQLRSVVCPIQRKEEQQLMLKKQTTIILRGEK